MSDLTRRHFLLGLGAMAIGSHPAVASGFLGQPARIVEPIAAGPALTGKLVAASTIGKNEGCVFQYDLASGELRKAGFPMSLLHDAVKVGDTYLAMPKGYESCRMITMDGEHKPLDPPSKTIAYSGHAIYDPEKNVIIATAYDRAKDLEGLFVLVDPTDYTIREVMPNGSYNSHDICYYDDDTIALGAYNFRHPYDKYDYGIKFRPHDNHSLLILYDRKTLKPKKTIPAYKDGLLSHIVMTKDKQLYAIGQQNFALTDFESKSTSDWRKIFADYAENSQPSLKDDVDGYAEHLAYHRIELFEKGVGMPIPNMYLPYGADEFKTISKNPNYDRRAQSICYNENTNMVGVSYPHTDGIMLINAATQEVTALSKAETSLVEVRGLTAIDGTPYMAAAGHQSGVAIIDTRISKVVHNIDTPIGRTIHMHYEPA